MQQYNYDYCDTYDSYDSGLTLDEKNSVKTFWCDECKQSKFILKKSITDPKFKCEECIQKKEEPIILPIVNPGVLNVPMSQSFQASPAMLTADGMYQQYQPYQLQQQEQREQREQREQQEQQEQQEQPQPTLDTTPQFTWRWFNFFV
jgi:hypothetical protein